LKVLSAGQHDIRIENIEPVMVIGDRDRLKQVLLNLGSNAIKFTPEGKRITLNLRVKDNWVRLSVCDEGPGMSKDEVGQLFERFYRGDKARKRYKGKTGFGLGLPIAYWIVRNHSGHIEVETELGKGSTFTVYLPVSQADMPTRPMLDNKM
jgi:signal transduction histidine kinase